ncbi:hypothetical protein SAMN05421846_102458 [Chryseobacterium taeanense]|uniref:Uncharacterized protein n=1 Tax=Chryseobacterium taeanense TaxID=311334 RepID=A0A1G8G7X5_9FLAO|nr:hypothetical protein [Chryseobacterium taeanense]SDH90371.1 hypothetical protein SAMN05421846_102458 [Chryseobacterium taeanense]
MSIGKKISLFIIISIVLIIYFFGYNYDYGNSYWMSMLFFVLILFSYVGLTLSIYEKVAGENPGKFFWYPWKKIKYVFLSGFMTIFLIILIFGTLFISLELSKQRKYKFLDSKETDKITGFIAKLDSIPKRYGKRPVAYLNYSVKEKKFEFELENKNSKYKLNQKIKLKYSSKHPDMFEILE